MPYGFKVIILTFKEICKNKLGYSFLTSSWLSIPLNIFIIGVEKILIKVNLCVNIPL